jgi:hypothetical protein
MLTLGVVAALVGFTGCSSHPAAKSARFARPAPVAAASGSTSGSYVRPVVATLPARQASRPAPVVRRAVFVPPPAPALPAVAAAAQAAPTAPAAEEACPGGCCAVPGSAEACPGGMCGVPPLIDESLGCGK